MDKNEMIFFAIVIVAYLLCAFMLNIPVFIHYVFIALILIVILATIVRKYKQKIEIEKISKISTILALIFLVIYIICTIYETIYQKTLIMDSAIILIPFFGALVVSWIFKKEK
jgi:predicted PurR-regulated permease PerM